MDYKHSCVVDADNNYKDFVQVIIENKGGKPTERVQFYDMSNGDSLVDIAPPAMRTHAGMLGYIKPQLDTTGNTWQETATPAEIAAWELAHPAPAMPQPTPDPRDLAIAQLMRDMAALKAKEAANG